MSDDTAAAGPGRPNVGPGDQIAGYRVEEQIGQGGMAVVYRAHDERLDRQVALKVLAPDLAADTAFRTRFIRESRAAAAVDHPNIIPVYDAGDAGGCLFISMRYVHGGDVRSLVAQTGPLPPARTWHIISQVASALDAAHSVGLVHRDVKPANMLLDGGSRTGSGWTGDTPGEPHDHVYLSDFGISKRTLASNLTSTGQFVGTLDYIAPEQIEGHAIDGRADQYSLACAAFELLSGSPPFPRAAGLALVSAHLTQAPPSLSARRPELGSRVDAVLAKAMAKSPGDRYPNCEQFAADLGRALGLVSGPLDAGSLPPGGGPGQPKPWPATELAGPAAAAAGAAMGGAPGTVPRDPGAAGGAPAAATPGGGAASGTPFDPSTMLAPPQHGTGRGGAGQAAGRPAPAPQQPRPTWPEQPAPGYGGPQYQQQYGQPGGPGGPGAPAAPGWQQQQYPPPPPRKSRKLLIGIAVAVLIIALGAGGAAAVLLAGKKHSTPPNGQSSSTPASPPQSSPPATTARAQATDISNLLASSRITRGMLGPAVSDIQNNCASLSASQLASDVATIKTVASQRQSEYSRAFGLQVDALANGTQLKNDLLDALQASLNADNAYLRWARQEQAGCFPASNSSDFNEAGSYDTQAVAAKTTFANEWNPVATQYSLPTVTEGNI